MREIEFRGKGIADGEWHYGDLIQAKDEIGKYIVFIIQNGYETKEDKIELDTCASPKVNTETVGQYTGLKDKNGKKIYEGDIVKDQYCIYEVVYDGNGYYVEVVRLLKECGTDKGVLYDLSDYKDLEVISNIYDNPELIEKVNNFK